MVWVRVRVRVVQVAGLLLRATGGGRPCPRSTRLWDTFECLQGVHVT